VTLDDATSAILSAFLVEEEGTDSTFRSLAEVFGLPLSLHTDRGSHYFHTPEAGGKVDRTRPTQVGRALAHLGVEHIAAHSPRARGRSERAFQTLQDRLTKELALAKITTIDAANACLRDIHIPAHNGAFRHRSRTEGQRFRRDPRHGSWRDPMHSRRTPSRQRQLCVVQPIEATNPGEPAARALL
jgi:hypothetical protein